MIASADAAAAAFVPGARTDTDDDLSALSERAAAYGYRLVPMSRGETESAPEAHPTSTAGMVRRLSYLKVRAEAAEVEGKAYRQEYEELRASLAEQMLEEGQSSSTVDGFTAYFAPRYSFARASEEVTSGDIQDALRESGQEHLVSSTYSYQKVLAYLRELVEDGAEVPEPLARLIEFKRTDEVRLRRSARH
jgi:hypothetical protein